MINSQLIILCTNEINQEWTIFAICEQEQIIFTACTHKLIILLYTHFQVLMRNDWEWTGKYNSWLI
jgi:hypothetical protein